MRTPRWTASPPFCPRPASTPIPSPAADPPLLPRHQPGRADRAPQGANKQLINEAVMQGPGVTATETAERTFVSATINRLKRNGELEPLGQGVRAPSGRRLVALAQ